PCIRARLPPHMVPAFMGQRPAQYGFAQYPVLAALDLDDKRVLRVEVRTEALRLRRRHVGVGVDRPGKVMRQPAGELAERLAVFLYSLQDKSGAARELIGDLPGVRKSRIHDGAARIMAVGNLAALADDPEVGPAPSPEGQQAIHGAQAEQITDV